MKSALAGRNRQSEPVVEWWWYQKPGTEVFDVPVWQVVETSDFAKFKTNLTNRAIVEQVVLAHWADPPT